MPDGHVRNEERLTDLPIGSSGSDHVHDLALPPRQKRDPGVFGWSLLLARALAEKLVQRRSLQPGVATPDPVESGEEVVQLLALQDDPSNAESKGCGAGLGIRLGRQDENRK